MRSLKPQVTGQNPVLARYRLKSLNELFVSFGKLKTATDPATYYLGDVYTSAK